MKDINIKPTAFHTIAYHCIVYCTHSLLQLTPLCNKVSVKLIDEHVVCVTEI